MCVSMTKQTIPQFSIVIRAYNAEKVIKDAINSVISQDYEGMIELVICYDKGSQDQTYEVISSYANNYYTNRKIIIIEHEHTTPFLSLLKGLKMAQGDFVAILDADNIMPKNYVSSVFRYIRTMEGMNNEIEYSFFYTNLLVTNLNYQIKFAKKQANVTFNSLLRRNHIDANSMIFSRRCLNKILPKLEDISKIRYFNYIYEDYLLALMAFLYCKPIWLPDIYVVYREHETNLTGITHRDPLRLLLSYERSLKTLLAFHYAVGKSLNKTHRLQIYLAIAVRLMLLTYGTFRFLLKSWIK